MPYNASRPVSDAPVFMTSVTLVAYEPGDLLYEVSAGVVAPASYATDQLTPLANKIHFAKRFVGICGSKKLVTDAGTQNVQVRLDPEYRFTAISATYAVGTFLAIDEAASGTALSDQIVEATTDPRAAIAVVVEAVASADTKVWGRLLTKWERQYYAINGDLEPVGQTWVAQTINMNDLPVVLTKDVDTQAGTLLIGNYLLVDAEGNVEVLTLPAEAECVNELLILKNTGGETITVNIDAGTLLVSLLTAEFSILHCDGTTWTQVAAAFT